MARAVVEITLHGLDVGTSENSVGKRFGEFVRGSVNEAKVARGFRKQCLRSICLRRKR